jgi:hypothetical protein
MEDVKIQFEGFSPPDFVKIYFKDLVEGLRDEAPVWSTVHATVVRVGEHFHGVIKITSSVEDFLAKASAHKVTELGRMLSEDMRVQLGRWKSTRFQTPTVEGAGCNPLPSDEISLGEVAHEKHDMANDWN